VTDTVWLRSHWRRCGEGVFRRRFARVASSHRRAGTHPVEYVDFSAKPKT